MEREQGKATDREERTSTNNFGLAATSVKLFLIAS